MANVKLFNQGCQEIGTVDLAPEVFEVEVQPELLHLVVRAQLAAKRAGTHSVKTRAFVSGGGKKPWRQKGTGRARAGSTRSPLWRGGAVVHGPQPRDYTFKVNRKVRQLALRMALSAKLVEDQLVLLDAIAFPEVKTKLMAKVVSDFSWKKALIVLPESDNNLELSARNLPGIKVVRQDMLNVYDVLLHDHVVMMKDAALKVQERLGHGIR
ncbi:50S ribosomal protein L4 [Solidesulfovibrio magneticus]|uniref:Large ribosomal subunit protein uL4 n=1 Tax=Solidesulfovibrio magneticus (strain ATCC 700980 / DSM 13731 / RS-1) TaxID=573370 RepID=RL4_SOLM1|nr:50S ribosomal protein L4 [Solidesulfovibrio magneticus]C4XLX4.1 RecName: Full=Large ribosomal subunit protein uL4; AltName: Full=50S ribosomal protein L4 [Solidesulfovibrio magneticus RS-1]BAH74712.1 50S ribosomal protein L4 [Solidesulfovibrio magneticus RS-1]